MGDYRPNAEKRQPGVVQSCMGSLSYNVELESGRQGKVHMDHLIHQAPGCVSVSSEPVPMVTGEEPSLQPDSRMVSTSELPRPQPLYTSEPSETFLHSSMVCVVVPETFLHSSMVCVVVPETFLH